MAAESPEVHDNDTKTWGGAKYSAYIRHLALTKEEKEK